MLLKKRLSIIAAAVFLCFLMHVSALSSLVFALTMAKQSVSLGNSIPGSVTTHTIGFTPADTTDAVKYIKLQYATSSSNATSPTGLSMSATPTITVSNNGTSLPNSATYAAGLVTITITTATVLSAAGTAVVITIPSVTNPNAGVFYVQMNNLLADNTTVTESGIAANQTTAGVVISGTIDPSIAFSVAGVASGVASGTTGAQNTTTATSTSTTIAFGHFLIGTNAASQLITTTTNAANGYSVALYENQILTAAVATIPNLGSNTTWVSGTTNGFGVNVTASTNSDANTTLFTANTLYAPIPVNASTLVLATKNIPTNTAGDSEYVNFQIGASSAYQAGTYTNTLSYILAPNF